MKFIAIIPSRYQSTRFPGKPLAMIGGKTMVRHVYERVSEVFEHCLVATDDSRILAEVKGFGGEAVMTSTQHRSGTDRCAEALSLSENALGLQFDAVVNVQGDEPLISREHLDRITEAFHSPDVQIATLVRKFPDGEDIFDPNTPKVVLSSDGFAMYFSRSAIPYIINCRREEWPACHAFYKHIGMYAYRADVLRTIAHLPAGTLEKAESLEQLRWLENGFRIKAMEVETESLSVDTPDDLLKVEKLMQSQSFH